MATPQATMTFSRGLNDGGARAVIVERLQCVARGLEGEVRSLGHGVSKLRINHGPGYRRGPQPGGIAVVTIDDSMPFPGLSP